MSGKCKEIRIHCLYIHLDMGYALGSVDNNNCTDLMSTICNHPNIVNQAKHIGHMGYGDNLRPLRNL